MTRTATDHSLHRCCKRHAQLSSQKLFSTARTPWTSSPNERQCPTRGTFTAKRSEESCTKRRRPMRWLKASEPWHVRRAGLMEHEIIWGFVDQVGLGGKVSAMYVGKKGGFTKPFRFMHLWALSISALQWDQVDSYYFLVASHFPVLSFDLLC